MALVYHESCRKILRVFQQYRFGFSVAKIAPSVNKYGKRVRLLKQPSQGSPVATRLPERYHPDGRQNFVTAFGVHIILEGRTQSPAKNIKSCLKLCPARAMDALDRQVVRIHRAIN